MYTWLTPAVYSILKCVLFKLIQNFCWFPCRLLIVSGNHHVLYMKSNPDHLDYLNSFGNDLVLAQHWHDQNIVHKRACKKSPLALKTTGLVQFLTIIGASDMVALQGRCLWMLNMVHGFDRYLFWSTLVYSNMWSSTVWTCNAGISCSFVQLLRWENIHSTSANSSLPNYFFSLLRLRLWKQSSFVISCKSS